MTPLPRRVSLGVALPAEGAFTAEGMRVGAVVPGSMAESAGLAAGDVVVGVGGLPVRSERELREATRRAAGERVIAVAATRGGRPFEARVAVVPRPVEVVEGQVVSHEQVVAADGARLRAIVTRPLARAGETGAGAAEGRRPAVLFVQGIGRESLDFGGRASSPVCRLIHGWARAGLVTMRLEKRGVGDSDGEDAGFDVEVEDCRAALRALAADASVDPGAVFVFGHSVGGRIAPLLCEDERGGRPEAERSEHDVFERPFPVRGILVMGTSARGWVECVAESTRRQLALRGAAADAIERAVQREREEGFGVRSAAYHAELAARDVGAAWDRAAAGADVLVIAGEHDWVVGDDEQAEIVARVNARRAGAAELARMAGMDHWMTRHASRAESLSAAGRGVFDEALVARTVAWMRRRAGARPAEVAGRVREGG